MSFFRKLRFKKPPKKGITLQFILIVLLILMTVSLCFLLVVIVNQTYPVFKILDEKGIRTLSEPNWGGVSAITDIVIGLLTIALLVSLHQGAKAIEEATKSRNADILNWAMSEMTDIKPAIKIVTAAGPRWPHWGPQAQEAAQNVSIVLQRLGYYAEQNLIDKQHFLNLWGPSYLACWYALRNWVYNKREELGEPKELMHGAFSRGHFELFAKYCEEQLPDLLVYNEQKQIYDENEIMIIKTDKGFTRVPKSQTYKELRRDSSLGKMLSN